MYGESKTCDWSVQVGRWQIGLVETDWFLNEYGGFHTTVHVGPFTKSIDNTHASTVAWQIGGATLLIGIVLTFLVVRFVFRSPARSSHG